MSQSLTALYLQNPQLANAMRRQTEASRLYQAGTDTSPVQSPWQGVARLAQALVGGYETGQADKEFKDAGDKQREQDAQFMAPFPGAMPMMPQAAAAPEATPMAPRAPVAQQALAPAEYEPLIQRASQETGIPANILTGLFAQESGFRPDARNPRSTATGIGQVLDSTAANPGYGLPPLSPEARLDPAQAIPWSARYLAARGQSLGVSDWNNPQQAERGLRAYGENTPEYAQAVLRRAGMVGDAIPAQMPGQGGGPPGAAPAPRTPDATGYYMAEAQYYADQAQRAIAAGKNHIAPILMQRAQMAQQMAAMRAPQPSENERMLEAAGYQRGTPEYQQVMRQLLERKGLPPTTNVNMPGNIPPGYQMRKVPGQDGADTYVMEPIPGGPADEKRQEKEKKQGERDAGTARSGSVVTQDIGRIFKLMDEANLPTTGMGATWLSSIPGTAASDIKSLVEGIGANIAFDRLQQMRESSPTGAALGAVSDTENRMLMSAYGSLSQSQSPAQFRENLNRLNTIYMDIIHGKGKWQEMRPSPPATGGADGWSIKPVQ